MDFFFFFYIFVSITQKISLRTETGQLVQIKLHFSNKAPICDFFALVSLTTVIKGSFNQNH